MMYVFYVIHTFARVPYGSSAIDSKITFLDWCDLLPSESVWMIPGTVED